ncbi:uncharacterized protein LOC128386577 [Panonychus citri]|uniref:uncharacterized protein LOC128386577 n=1 Tax=Panonychus citri TaxID=50023 RepID=UPI002307EAEE|nr:uncharacterized protein LOC128386577 [Panonychus citri]
MGCRLSKSYLTIIESPSNSGMNNQSIESVKDAHELINFLRDENHSNYKCIFIFGGYGSNKGEFIFDLLNDDLKRGDKIKDQLGWHYVYLDVEELIVKNIKKRVKQLTGPINDKGDDDQSEGETVKTSESDNQSNNQQEGQELKENEVDCKSEKQREDNLNCKLSFDCDEINDNLETESFQVDGRWEDTGFLKKYFSELTNVITNNWVRSLIEKEIINFDSVDPRTKFIINLVPNRINLFRDCLYLKQGPNLMNFEHNYVAVNLIRADQTRKDLDLIFDFHSYEDISDYFVEYFRSIKKLIEVKIESKKMEPQLRISRLSSAVKIKDCQQLEQLIKCLSVHETLEVDISEFSHTFDRKGSLVFLIDNQIDTGREIIAIDSSETDVKSIRNFVHFYCQIKESIDH